MKWQVRPTSDKDARAKQDHIQHLINTNSVVIIDAKNRNDAMNQSTLSDSEVGPIRAAIPGPSTTTIPVRNSFQHLIDNLAEYHEDSNPDNVNVLSTAREYIGDSLKHTPIEVTCSPPQARRSTENNCTSSAGGTSTVVMREVNKEIPAPLAPILGSTVDSNVGKQHTLSAGGSSFQQPKPLWTIDAQLDTEEADNTVDSNQDEESGFEEVDEYEECNSTDEEELIKAFVPGSSWNEVDPDDAIIQHTNDLIMKRNLSPRNREFRKNAIIGPLTRAKIKIVSVQEPFVEATQIEQYRRTLGLEKCMANVKGTIWLFWSAEFEATVIANDHQLVTMKFIKKGDVEPFWMSFVYAKNKEHLRVPLWDSLRECNSNIEGMWCISGDFNVIVSPEEKKGGNPHKLEKSWDFIDCMDDCGMVDSGFIGPRFTWCNNRDRWNRIWKRLDKVFINQEWTAKFSRVSVEHLTSTGLDHTPILVKCSNSNFEGTRYFKFLNFWADQLDFHNVVKSTWEVDIEGNVMWRF
ncbi:hypothetical protein A4A49_18367 [Nicotiana attenuata]|uniref:DUF4283 domain-containing protein n=1 Tax=Nicotiana attenuata TaxID=49451 RepID=A0A314KH43_NICAT|nr:hypothetical protein A4A49_18367 [Nicotiana attenuata]